MARLRRGLGGNKRGQFLILTTLGIVVLMVTLSSLLSYTAVSPIHFSKTSFRKMTTELNLNFRRALAIALADASKELEHKAATGRYVNFTKLEDYPEAEKKGLEFMTKWHNTTLMKYAGLGINLTISKPVFQCNWGSYQGYSGAEANMSLDILSYGFYGWKTQAIVEVTPTILGLKETDGNRTSFYFTVKGEFGTPISEFTTSAINVLFQKRSGTYRTTTVGEITYFGEGTYLLKYYTNMLPILDALYLLETYVMELGDASFIPPNSPKALCNKVDAVINQYLVENYWGAYQKLSYDVRPHLDTTKNQTWVYEYIETDRELALIDDILSQLFPRIKLILDDQREITVGASAGLIRLGDDTMGPRTENLLITPNPVIVPQSDLATLTARISDFRSDILCAEYFIGAPGADGTGKPMVPVDGAFDSPREDVWAQINVTSWEIGDYIIYVHGRDTVGNWGGLNSTVLRITNIPHMHINSIEMSWRTIGRRAKATVTIFDSEGKPVEGAMVYGTWTYTKQTSNNVSGVTNPQGQVTFLSKYVSAGGTFTFTVYNVTLSGWIYAYWDNVETSDHIP